MSVYIEYVILDNLVIDYIILYAVSKTLRLNAGRARLFLSAAAGAALAVALPLINAGQLVLLLIKLACGGVMVAAISPPKLKKLIWSYILFVTYTFVLGGAVIGALYLSGADIYAAATLGYSGGVPAGVIAGACFIYILLLMKLVKYLYRRKHILPFARKIVITYGGRDYESSGFLDSGNRMYDDGGNPVIILSPSLLHKMLDTQTVLDMYSGRQSGMFTRKEFITAHYKKSYMYLFKIVRLLIYSGDKANTIVNVSAGAALGGFEGIEGCEALLHGDMIEDE